MPNTLIIFVLSSVGLALWTFLLRAEDKKGNRVLLSGLRGRLDTGLLFLSEKISYLFQHYGGRMIRQTIHFIIHRFLRLLLSGVRALEALLRKLQRTNRNVAQTIVAVDEETHLGEIRSHANSIKMSPEEKRIKRRELLE